MAGAGAMLIWCRRCECDNLNSSLGLLFYLWIDSFTVRVLPNLSVDLMLEICIQVNLNDQVKVDESIILE